MKKQFITLGLAVAALVPAHATDVGVSIEVSQPGVYGRIDIGRFPQPQVFVAQPIVVQRPAVVVARPEPVYMWVPPGHRKNWSKHCHRYNACAAPVYFVQDNWYQQNVMAPAQKGGGKGPKHDGHGGKHDKGGHDKGKPEKHGHGKSGKHD